MQAKYSSICWDFEGGTFSSLGLELLILVEILFVWVLIMQFVEIYDTVSLSWFLEKSLDWSLHCVYLTLPTYAGCLYGLFYFGQKNLLVIEKIEYCTHLQLKPGQMYPHYHFLQREAVRFHFNSNKSMKNHLNYRIFGMAFILSFKLIDAYSWIVSLKIY